MALVSLLQAIFSVVFNALVAYDMTDEGHMELENLLALVEQAGFDIPGWEPNEGIDISVPGVDVQSAIDDMAKRWVQRNSPEGKVG